MWSIGNSSLGRIQKCNTDYKLGPCGTWSVWQAMVMEVEVLEVASHLTPILLPCTLILEVCSGANDGPKGSNES
jgi:hypothetical protein